MAAKQSKAGDGVVMKSYIDALNEARNRAEGLPNRLIKSQAMEQEPAASEMDNADFEGIAKHDSKEISDFYKALSEGVGSVFRWRGFYAGMSRGRFVYVDEQVPLNEDGTPKYYIEFKFVTTKNPKVIKLDEWFVARAEDGGDTRGSGLGTRFMTMAMEQADALGLDVELMAWPTRNYQGTEAQNMKASKRLKKYYSSLDLLTRTETA